MENILARTSNFYANCTILSTFTDKTTTNYKMRLLITHSRCFDSELAWPGSFKLLVLFNTQENFTMTLRRIFYHRLPFVHISENLDLVNRLF